MQGCANITGGGLLDNLIRVIPNDLGANIYLNNIKILKIFSWLKKQGINEKEMLKTFNCGIGFCIIIKKKNLWKIKKYFSKKYQPYIIGSISHRKNKINTYGKINWD